MILGKRQLRRVHLVDAQDEMGGIMRWIPRLPGLGEWARIVNYRKIQIDKLKNVQFIPNTRLDAEGVKDYGADTVVIATGGYWATDGLNGVTHNTIPGADASLPHCLTPEQIMVEGKEVPGGRVVVYDCDGYFTAIGLAERLQCEGRDVVLMTPHAEVAPYTFYTGEGFRINRRLHQLGITLAPNQTVHEVRATEIVVSHVFATDRTDTMQTDAIVLVTQRVSNDALYRELSANKEALSADGVLALHRIGDCLVPRLIADAIFDGHQLGREIGALEYVRELPFNRERAELHRDRDGDGDRRQREQESRSKRVTVGVTRTIT
jgi:dimethylamine/trimethylamine dehydrogenase